MSTIPAGYKQTEIGVIPEDWDVKPIKQFADTVRGGSPRPAGDPRFFNGSYIPWLTVASLTNIPASQLVLKETATYLTEEGSHHSRTLLPETLIIANSGATLGISKILGIKCCANDGIAALLNVDENIDTQYLAHFINTKTIYLREVVATGNGQPNLNTDLIGNFSIPLPPTKTEQQLIATALSDTDALIESLEKLIAKKRQIKQGARQELLTPKEGLEVKKFGEIFDITAGGDLRKDEFSDVFDEKYPYPIYSNAHTNHGLYGYCKTFDYDGVALTITARGGIGYTVVRDHSFSAIGRLLILKPHKGVQCKYVAEFINLKIEFVSESTGVPQLTAPQVSKYEINLPSEAEQIAIATILSDMDAEIAALEERLEKTRTLKSGMMHELLTGRIRLI